MVKITFEELRNVLQNALLGIGLNSENATLCADIFANSTLDGYHSHGVNRFVEFVKTITDGYVQVDVEPTLELSLGSLERWDGHLGPGPLNAHFSMGRAIQLAKQHGMGCVALKNGSHWMRGGSYGWQAANENCIGICFTNTEPNMPTWGAMSANTGNNPLIISIPREEGHIVLDISMSQFSYGKMNKYILENRTLPFPGGFDEKGELTTDPSAIIKSRRVLPTGYWKGAGLSIMLDMVVTLLASGRSTAKIGEMEVEYGLSQVFICFDTEQLNAQSTHNELVEEIIDFITAAVPTEQGHSIEYPGSQTLKRRAKHLEEGIPINEDIWKQILAL